MIDVPVVINAAGKLTALGGSTQSEAVANAQAKAARQQVDLAALRALAGRQIAELTGAEAACVTTGAAAGITISVAALVCGSDDEKVQSLPLTGQEHPVLLQAGHAINFGASVEQMIRLGGGIPLLLGERTSVPQDALVDALDSDIPVTAFLYVQSHHCVQENMIGLARCIELCRSRQVPVIIDAAAEEDLEYYIAAGADLVTYSGGKAFGGPTTGFIAGRSELIENCERQFQGIARTMKVGKEGIMGLLQALQEYRAMDHGMRHRQLDRINALLLERIEAHPHLIAEAKADEAGRSFSRIAVRLSDHEGNIRDLVRFLKNHRPSIRTRNHHLHQGYLLIDPRELSERDAVVIADCLDRYSPDT